MSEWLEREAVIIVKAYPNPSDKYHETVCVAAITKEEGWIRLYPVQFRQLPEAQRFKKYQLVRMRMRKHEKDRRPESYRLDESSIQIGKQISSDEGWRHRWDWVRPTIGPSMCGLLKLQKQESRSLACIKPRSVEGITIEAAAPDWEGSKKSAVDQMVLFDTPGPKLEKVPYAFRYKYHCEDEDCSGHHQSIIDWELMELYRKVRHNGEASMMQLVREKYLNELCGPRKDTYFFVGNHSKYQGSFMVLGVCWPPKQATKQLSLLS